MVFKRGNEVDQRQSPPSGIKGMLYMKNPLDDPEALKRADKAKAGIFQHNPLANAPKYMSVHGTDAQKKMQYETIRNGILEQGGEVRDRKNHTASGGIEVKMIDTSIFVAFFGFVAFANMIIVGMEANFACSRIAWCTVADDRGSWYIVEILFTLLFCLEMGIRIFCLKPVTYFRGDILANPWGFAVLRCIDFGLVFFRAIDTFILEPSAVATPIKIISCFRVCHLAEIIRRNHTMKHFREVVVILHSIWDAGRVVFWTFILMFVFLYVMAVVMTDLVGKAEKKELYDYSRSAWEPKPWTVDDYWGTVPRSIFSLFQVVTLDHWSSSLVRPLVMRHPAFIFIFIPFLVIVVLSMLNVIVAIIVESVMSSAKMNEEKVSKETEKAHAKVVESLKNIFLDADLDGSGDLDLDELNKALQQQHVVERLKFLQIDHKDLRNLFELLDENESGAVPTETFFRGCSRLRGLAQSSDLHHMMVDFGRYNHWCSEMVETHKQLNNSIFDTLLTIESVDRDIVKSDDDFKDPVLMTRRHRFMSANAANTGRHHHKTLADHPWEEADSESELWSGGDENSHAGTEDSHNRKRSKTTLVAMSLKNTEGYDDAVTHANSHRKQHGLPRQETYREEYDHALEHWQHENSHRRKSQLSIANQSDGEVQSADMPKLTDRAKKSSGSHA
jgi:voltage-gated sodium channel